MLLFRRQLGGCDKEIKSQTSFCIWGAHVGFDRVTVLPVSTLITTGMFLPLLHPIEFLYN